MNILVLCTGNSARSILFEVLLNSMTGDNIHAFSAGSKPVGTVNPHAITLLKNKGHDVSNLRSKSWDEFTKEGAPEIDIVITVCGNAANEPCPIWLGAPIRIHWGFDDPAHIVDSHEATKAFEATYKAIEQRISDFIALPLETLNSQSLEKAMQALTKKEP